MLLAAILMPVLLVQTPKVQSKDTKVGTGAAVVIGDRVTVDYTGKLTNGKQFDSSIGKAPFVFIVGGGEVIKGWDQGLVGMKTGGKRTLTIPSALGYGAAGAGDDIPPNSTLVFTIEVKKIEHLSFTVLKKGTGDPVAGPANVKVFYKGSLTDGKEFDSNYGKDAMPVQIGARNMIPGFTMALIGMKKGEKRKVTIPAELAYGARAVGPIPANSKLIFEIELSEITK
ncbi:FKBP-type peptidyl-prolyl cis-trans isomerase [soil metagenome]